MSRKFQGSAFMLFLMLYIVGLNLIIIPMLADVMTAIGQQEPFLRLVFSPWGIIIFPQMIGLMLPLVIWLTFKRESIHQHMPMVKLGSTNIILIIFMSIFLQPLMMLISGISGLFTPNLVGDAVGGMVRQYPWWLLMLAIAVTPSIIEEILFRGYIQSVYKDRPFRRAAIINGLFFGIMHINLQQFFYAFVMGIIFAYMVHYTRSVVAGMLSHFIMNGIQVTLIYFSMQMPISEYLHESNAYYNDGYNASMFAISDEFLGILSIGVIALIATPCAYVLFRAFRTYNRQRNVKYDLQEAFNNTNNSISAKTEGSLAEFIKALPTEPEETSKFKHFLSQIDPFAIAAVVIFVILLL